MGEFKNKNFVVEFAYRTKLNYYNQIKRVANEKNKYKEEQRIQDIINQIKIEMTKKKYTHITDYYEITDLLNSLIGLLVFPKEEYYNALSSNKDDLDKTFPILSEYINNGKGNYENTYPKNNGKNKETYGQQGSPKEICRHLRNSLAHQNLEIFPNTGTISKKSGKKNRQIESITFTDHDNKNNWSFSLTIYIKDLENVLMEICDHLINIH